MKLWYSSKKKVIYSPLCRSKTVYISFYGRVLKNNWTAKLNEIKLNWTLINFHYCVPQKKKKALLDELFL